MAWQDELRRLDEEWAAGRLSEDDYQRHRAELAAQVHAESGGTPAPGGTLEQGATPIQGPTPEQATRSSPFPPAFRWEGAPKEPPHETTDVIDPVGGGDAESTQIVPAQPPPVPSYDDSESTQVVQVLPPSPSRYDPPSSSGGGFPAAPDQWAQEESAPPWASPNPSPFQEPDSEWRPQGFDTFESQRSSKTPFVMAIVAVVVVVLVGGGLGAYWLWGPNGTSDAADRPPVAQEQPAAPGPQQEPAAPEQPPPPAPEAQPAPPPGSDLPDPADIGGDGEPRVLSTLEQLRSADVLPPQAYEALANAGATSSKLFASSYPDGLRATVLITRLGSANAATAARHELAGLQGQDDLQELQRPVEPGLRTFHSPDDPEPGPTTVRGLYHSGNLLVWMEAVGQEQSPTVRLYLSIVSQQLATLAPDI